MSSIVCEMYNDTDMTLVVSPEVSSFIQEYISTFGNSETKEVYFENKNIKAIDALLEKHFNVKIDISWKLERCKNMKKLFETCPLMFEGLWEGVYNPSFGMKISGYVEHQEITRVIKKRQLPPPDIISVAKKEYKQVEKKIKVDVEKENNQKLEEDGREFFSKLQQWFETCSQPYIHDFGNTVIAAEKCRNVINYMAEHHNSYQVQDKVHGNVLKVLKV